MYKYEKYIGIVICTKIVGNDENCQIKMVNGRQVNVIPKDSSSIFRGKRVSGPIIDARTFTK